MLTKVLDSRTMKGQAVLTEISVGELVDKITILQIKSERIKDSGKLKNIRRELEILTCLKLEILKPFPELEGTEAELKKINEEIWDLEDQVRDHEHREDFGATFVSVARSIYKTNDRRADLKRRINDFAGSSIIEEKSYACY